MNVFEYEHTEEQRILENQTDESATQQSQGDSRKKYRREEDRRKMQFGVFSGLPVDDDCDFTDEETTEVSLVQEMEEARETRVLELRREAPVVFMEYRN